MNVFPLFFLPLLNRFSENDTINLFNKTRIFKLAKSGL
ncbi:hypothetical protein PAHA111176_12780 [Parendozoicomonas haliclonae]|uniref:Uncharacterized protein n=1 Tax=Parendozoicomonas haliclonae TaxID=1960125 RepID=A0A1X7AM77_9GAMM|nr:hypothetical protein EHSB41UT_03028 [Parendozoicomonas haliclonae]